METLQIRPKYLFGKDAMFGLENELKNHSYQKAMIMTGSSSYKRNGSFNDLLKVLLKINLPYVHFEGIEPNPKCTTLDKCIEVCRSQNVDVIFALGGGSVIDSAKVVAVLTKNLDYINTWEYILNPKKAKNDAINVIAINTLAGTGSENNSYSVISNPVTKEKKSSANVSATPIISVQDPAYTFTVDAWQTASGIFDCFSHLLEQYFGKSTFSWTKEYIFANLRVLINYAKMVILKPLHFEARANIFWTTSMALNGLACFRCIEDWSVHTIEHALSGLWDITHGAGLAFVTPTYLQVRANNEQWFKDKVIELGRNVFKTRTFDATITFLINFIKSINLPVGWNEFDKILDFSDADVQFLINHATRFGDANNKPIYEAVITKLKDKKY